MERIMDERKVVEFGEGRAYFLRKERTNYNQNQYIQIPTKVVCDYWGSESIEGIWYDKYVPTSEGTIYFYVNGSIGTKNILEILKDLSTSFTGGVIEDGKTIESKLTRFVEIEDINELLGIKVDYRTGKVYQKKYGTVLYESDTMGKNYLSDDIGMVTNDYYNYNMDRISIKQNTIQKIKGHYHLASEYCQLISSDSRLFKIGLRRINNMALETDPFVERGKKRGYVKYCSFRPVFYIKSTIQEGEDEGLFPDSIKIKYCGRSILQGTLIGIYETDKGFKLKIPIEKI